MCKGAQGTELGPFSVVVNVRDMRDGLDTKHRSIAGNEQMDRAESSIGINVYAVIFARPMNGSSAVPARKASVERRRIRNLASSREFLPRANRFRPSREGTFVWFKHVCCGEL